MEIKLSPKHKLIHQRALVAASSYQKAEAEMILVLQEVDRESIHKRFGKSSLLKYAIEFLNLSEPVALSFIAVARKSSEVPVLKAAVCKGQLSVATANRLVSTITKENASELIQFAATHSWRENERELARRNPKAAVRDKVKMLGNGLVEITVTVTEDEYKDFERACSIEAQRKSAAPKRSDAFVECVQAHLDKYDPVRKAERAQMRAEKAPPKSVPQKTLPKSSVRTDQNSKQTKDSKATPRIPLSAAEVHAVQSRDQGRCTHVNESGVRCNQDRWTEIHHIVPVSKGGTNNVYNLTTLCSFHHDLAHQLTLPLEGQITWLRDLRAPYG